MPWRPQPDRLEAHKRVRAFWDYHGFRVIESDCGSGKFNLSQARNYAVMRAKTRHVIVADADTLPDIASVIASLDEFDGVTWPYETYRHIPSRYAAESDLMTANIDRQYGNSVGGIFICQLDTYWRLGGCDEKFVGWGWEDNAFHMVAETLSRCRRQPGITFSFNHFDGDPRHDAYRDMTTSNPNYVRAQLYKACFRRPDLMRELIR
jgi:hypothetical protein